MLAQQLAELAHHATPHGSRHRAPLQERVVRPSHGLLDVLDVVGPEVTDDRSVDRGARLQVAPVDEGITCAESLEDGPGLRRGVHGTIIAVVNADALPC